MKITNAWTNDGWHAYYVDNELVFEGHSIPESYLFSILNIPYESVHINEAWIENRGYATQHLSDLVLEDEEG
jgi:hypothetical protein